MVILMLKLFKYTWEKTIYMVYLTFIFLLRFIFLFNRIINGNACCSNYAIKSKYLTSSICYKPKWEGLWNFYELLLHDFNKEILFFSGLFILYSIFYLIKTHKIKQNIWGKIIIILGCLCVLYLILISFDSMFYYA